MQISAQDSMRNLIIFLSTQFNCSNLLTFQSWIRVFLKTEKFELYFSKTQILGKYIDKCLCAMKFLL